MSQFSAQPARPHWEAVKRIFRYLNSTLTWGIAFGGDEPKNRLEAYCDADFAGDLNSRRSTRGYLLSMNNGPIAWRSKRQAAIECPECCNTVSVLQASLN